MSEERTVWYRKWRPQTFSAIAGQEHVTRTLRNAVSAGRVAHAYLLCGPRGTGKTTTARVLAKAVNCANPDDGEPCDRCESCVAVREGRALDLVEMDAASNRGIDDIRGLRDRVGYAASGGRFKVYLIDEVHELTQQAFDALLKTLEEPPPHVIFVLATTDAHKVPATIVSRCQRFDLTRARPAELAGVLESIAAAEGVAVTAEALQLVVRAATGSFRDATSLLEQLVAAYGPSLSAEHVRAGLGLTGDARAFDLARAAIERDLPTGLVLIGRVRDDGVDMRQFCREVTATLRSLLMLRAGVADDALDAAGRAALEPLVAATDTPTVTRALKTFASADFRADPQASLPLELALAEICLAGVADAAPPTVAEDGRGVAAPAATRQAAAAPESRPAAQPPQPLQPAPTDLTASLRERLAAHTGAETAPARPPAARRTITPPPPAPQDAEPYLDSGDSEDAPTLSLAEARARYRDIYQQMQGISRLAASRINMGDIIAIDNNSLTIGLPHAIQVEKLATGTDAYQALVQAVSAVFGRRYAVHCLHKHDVEDRLRAQPTHRSHLLDAALELGARPV